LSNKVDSNDLAPLSKTSTEIPDITPKVETVKLKEKRKRRGTFENDKVISKNKVHDKSAPALIESSSVTQI
jgi:hypothetical protein